jgi:hypothetical protein
MIVISHRGNTNGRNEIYENNPLCIEWTLSRGYDVEVDVWCDEKSNRLSLGHDYPQYSIKKKWLNENKKHLWCHAKNLAALFWLSQKSGYRFFWHQNDDFTLTSNGIIWTYPNKEITKNSIIVAKTKPETLFYAQKEIYGICTDYPEYV